MFSILKNCETLQQGVLTPCHDICRMLIDKGLKPLVAFLCLTLPHPSLADTSTDKSIMSINAEEVLSYNIPNNYKQQYFVSVDFFAAKYVKEGDGDNIIQVIRSSAESEKINDENFLASMINQYQASCKNNFQSTELRPMRTMQYPPVEGPFPWNRMIRTRNVAITCGADKEGREGFITSLAIQIVNGKRYSINYFDKVKKFDNLPEKSDNDKLNYFLRNIAHSLKICPQRNVINSTEDEKCDFEKQLYNEYEKQSAGNKVALFGASKTGQFEQQEIAQSLNNYYKRKGLYVSNFYYALPADLMVDYINLNSDPAPEIIVRNNRICSSDYERPCDFYILQKLAEGGYKILHHGQTSNLSVVFLPLKSEKYRSFKTRQNDGSETLWQWDNNSQEYRD